MKVQQWLVLTVLLLVLFFRADAMEQTEVREVLQRASAYAEGVGASEATIAVVDREGYVLGVWDLSGHPSPPDARVLAAISKAGTAAFLSSNQHAFTTRTGGFLIQQHFPPGVRNRPPGPLVGLGLSSLPFSDTNHFKTTPAGDPIAGTSIVGNPGGVPLYKNGVLLGGVGVSTDGDLSLQVVQEPTQDEEIALAAQQGLTPHTTAIATNVAIDGLALPYIESSLSSSPGSVIGGEVSAYPIQSSPAVSYPSLAGYEGEVRSPIIADPKGSSIKGEARLSEEEVLNLIRVCIERAQKTRAGIRTPRGQAARLFISVLSNPDQEGEAPAVLGTFRMPDATMFSWDISVQKGRTVLFFSNDQRAYSARTINFLSQSLYPPGIDGTTPGPFFGLQEKFSDASSINPNLVNGMTLFPGAFPLYRNGVMIGALSVSGDGVDQDDYVAAAGAELFPAPQSIRADKKRLRGARLPYAKFPRNPQEF